MYSIGVDIGGTNVKIGLIDDSLAIAQRISIPFPHTTPEDMVAKIRRGVEAILAQQGISMTELASVGAIVPGSVSRDDTTVIDAYNLGFHNVPLKKLLQDVFPECPVYITNDADGAALAELAGGAFRNAQSGILLTLGTGLGGGIILNGKLFRGGTGQGCELGHAFLVYGGEHCTCGNDGCMETYVSASALIRDGIAAMTAHPESSLAAAAKGNPENVTARLVIDCARTGDPSAVQVFDTYVDRLGAVCASFFNILDPEVIAIGGGVCGAGDFLFEPLRKKTDSKCFYPTHGAIVPAEMGNDAGMIGAAMLHRNAEG